MYRFCHGFKRVETTGKELQDMWNSFSPKLSLLSEEYSFKDYYDGYLLISSMQALFLKIYDFTNILS